MPTWRVSVGRVITQSADHEVEAATELEAREAFREFWDDQLEAGETYETVLHWQDDDDQFTGIEMVELVEN